MLKGVMHCAYNNFLILAPLSYRLGDNELCIWALVISGVFAYGVEGIARVDETLRSNTRKGVEFEGNLLGRVEYSSELGGVLLSHLGLIRSV